MTDVKIRVIGEDKATRELAGIDKKLMSMAKSMGLAVTAAAALKKAWDFTKESTLLAARVETLGAVTEVMGRNAGISAEEVRKLEAGIQSMGITTQASRQSLAQMMRAEIDLAKSTDLARLAQDAAVISGENSSQAFEKLTQIIGTGNTYMARRMGLLVDFEGVYKKLADSLGKPVDSLTQLEKVQARTNEVMAQGKTISGAYTAAMETGGKQIQSYARHAEELKVAFGNTFQRELKIGIQLLTENTDVITNVLTVNNMLTESYRAGNITRAEAIKLKLQILATDKKLEDGIEELTEAEKERNEALDQASKIMSQAGTYEAYKDRMLDLVFAVRDLNVELDLLTETEWTVKKETEDTDRAMLQYTKNIELVTDAVEKTLGPNAQLVSGNKELAGSSLNAAHNTHKLGEALDGTKSSMDGLNMSLINTITSWKEQVAWFTGGGAEIQAAADAAWQKWLASDKTEADKNIFETTVNNATLATLDLQEELGLIDSDGVVEELVKMGYPIETAIAMAKEFKDSLYAITSQQYLVKMNVQWNDPGIESGHLGGGGTPTTPITTGGGGGTYIPPEVPYIGDYQHGTNGWLGVPPSGGYITLDPGEKFSVKPSGESDGGITNNINIYSNQDPQAIAQELIREIGYRM